MLERTLIDKKCRKRSLLSDVRRKNLHQQLPRTKGRSWCWVMIDADSNFWQEKLALAHVLHVASACSSLSHCFVVPFWFKRNLFWRLLRAVRAVMGADPNFTGVADADAETRADTECTEKKDMKDTEMGLDIPAETCEPAPTRIMLLVMLSMFQGYASMVGPLQSAYKHELGVKHGTGAAHAFTQAAVGVHYGKLIARLGHNVSSLRASAHEPECWLPWSSCLLVCWSHHFWCSHCDGTGSTQSSSPTCCLAWVWAFLKWLSSVSSHP